MVVELRTAALNRRDLLVCRGAYPFPLPLIPGSDGAGVRRDTGEEVVIYPALGWGDREEAPGPGLPDPRRPARRDLRRAHRRAGGERLPEAARLSWEEAAALPLAALTAYRALFSRGGLRAGETVLVLGAGSGVSTFAVQLAAQAGARVLVTSSSDEKIERSRALGAEGGVNYATEDWVAAVKELGGADLVIDSVGSTWPQSLDCLRPGGRVVVFGATGGTEATLPVRPFYFGQLSLLGTMMGSPADFAGLLGALASGRLAAGDRLGPSSRRGGHGARGDGEPAGTSASWCSHAAEHDGVGDPAGQPVVCLHGVTGHGRRFAARRGAAARATASSASTIVATAARAGSRRGASSSTSPTSSRRRRARDLRRRLGRAQLRRQARRGARGPHPDLVERAVLLDPAMHIDPAVAGERADLTRADVSFASPDEAVEARLADGSLFTTPREILEEETREHLVEGPDGRFRWQYAPAAVIVAWSEMSAGTAVAAVPDARRLRRAVVDPGRGPAHRQHRAGPRPRRAQRPLGRLRRDRRRDRALPELTRELAGIRAGEGRLRPPTLSCPPVSTRRLGHNLVRVALRDGCRGVARWDCRSGALFPAIARGQLPCCTGSRAVSCSSVSTACCGSGIASNSFLMR